MDTIKASRLRSGQTIRFISPSAGLGGIFPHRIERAKEALKSQGYYVSEGALIRKTGERAGSAAERTSEIHLALIEPSVGAMVATSGGNYVCREVLPHLDYKLVRRNPKILVGYSDVTALLLGLYTRAGLVTFYGPTAIAEFGEYPAVQPYTLDYFLKAITKPSPIGEIQPASEWTEEVLDWATGADLNRARMMQPNPGPEWLRQGQATGVLLGGCLEVIDDLLAKAPEFLPDFTGSLFFWELAETGVGIGNPPANAARYLNNLKAAGILDKSAGMVVGRPYCYNAEWHSELKQHILEIFDYPDRPVLYNADFGHTDPKITIPIGVSGEIDSARNTFSILEAGVNA
jgi:muramoyltetrapeptide carboxypeptidase LdcA involved in peptidoglycan recycling